VCQGKSNTWKEIKAVTEPKETQPEEVRRQAREMAVFCEKLIKEHAKEETPRYERTPLEEVIYNRVVAVMLGEDVTPMIPGASPANGSPSELHEEVSDGTEELERTRMEKTRRLAHEMAIFCEERIQERTKERGSRSERSPLEVAVYDRVMAAFLEEEGEDTPKLPRTKKASGTSRDESGG
jgi:hypothetical protein